MDNAKKKRMKKYISWTCIGALVLGLTVMPLLAKNEVEENGPVASIHSGTVEKGAVSTALHGGGTLSTEDAEDVKLPSGVKITEFLVKNGDVVTEGTPLASVDKVSVMTAITQVRETMEYLQEKIEESRSEKVSSYVSATAGGRVKVVYAEAGDSVQDVMLEHGALAILSLDSLMAVQIERKMDISTGDSVCVTLSDGTEVTGRVESNLDGMILITVEDTGYDIGEPVTVTTEDGNKVGQGMLAVHNAWKATAFTGTISTVYAKEEKEVYAGSTLFTLKDTDFTAQLEYLANQHREYEELMQDLFRMYESGTIDAPCDGVVSGVDPDSAFLLSGEPVEWEAMPLENTTEEKGWTVMLLSAQSTGNSGEGPGENGTEDGDTTGPETGGQAAVTYTGYAGKVDFIGSSQLILRVNEAPCEVIRQEDGTWDLSKVNLDTEQMLTPNVTVDVADALGYEVGDLVVVLYDSENNVSVILAQKANPDPGTTDPSTPTPPGEGQYPGMGGLGGKDFSGMLSGMMGAMSGMTGSNDSGTVTQETDVKLFDLEGDVLMTVTPQDTVSLTITLDERDIAKVSVGQSAEVKVGALRGQVFEAEVIEVSTSGTNSGGSSKFTAKLRMDYSENMLDGMSATASLPLYTKMDVLTIPVEALVEQGARTVVYTGLEEKTGEPGSPVEVTIGLSDGITAEILSGLKLGDEYYYSYYDVLELDTSAEAQKYTFG